LSERISWGGHPIRLPAGQPYGATRPLALNVS
jgi:hypothetical protein